MTVESMNDADPILGVDKVERDVGLSRTTIWRECHRGRFPKPVKISPGRIGWFNSEIKAWKAALAAARAA